MADPHQPESPTQGEANSPPQIEADGPHHVEADSPTQVELDADSGPHADQQNGEIPDESSEKELRQILQEQEVGKFDFDRDFGVIKNEDDFENRLREYDSMTDDDPKRPTDFPIDPKIQRQYVRRVAEAMLDMDGATDNKIKDRRRTNKSGETTTKSKADVPAAEDPGDKEKDSVAVKLLRALKLVEIELLSWKVVIFSRDAQERRLSRGAYGCRRIPIRPFASWTERIECIIWCLETTKTVARSIIREGDPSMKDFVADPKAKVDIANRNRTTNYQRAEEKDAARKAKGAVLRKTQPQSDSPIGAQNISAATGSPQDESTPNALESYRTRDGHDVQGDVGSGSSTEEKQNEPSAITRDFPKGRRTHSGPSTQEDGSSVPTPASPTVASTPTPINAGNDHNAAGSSGLDLQQPNPSAFNEFVPESVGGDFSPPLLLIRALSKDNQRLAQSSRAPTTGLSAVAGLPSSAIQPLPSAATQSTLGGVSFHGGVSDASGTRASAKKRSRMSSEPQDDYVPGTRGANATRAPKRQKRYQTKGDNDLDTYDMEREEDDDYVDEEEG